MSTFFVFSDESGTYKKERNSIFIKSFPFYIRASICITDTDWKFLRTKFTEQKKKMKLPLDREIKWSYLWSIFKYQSKNIPIPNHKDFYFLKEFDYFYLMEFVEYTFSLLYLLHSPKIFITITDNQKCAKIEEQYILKEHLQELMQRIQMDMQSNPNNLAILFADQISEDKNKLLRDAYNSIYITGDFIRSYSHIKDSIDFEYSHHSIGIQYADFIAGCFSGMMRGFARSRNLFKSYIEPFLRVSKFGEIMGYGIREVPRDNIVRTKITNITELSIKKTTCAFDNNCNYLLEILK